MYTKMTAYERFMSLHPATAAPGAISEFGRHIAEASRLRRDRRTLNEISDSSLRDIGVSRHGSDARTSSSARDTSLRD